MRKRKTKDWKQGYRDGYYRLRESKATTDYVNGYEMGRMDLVTDTVILNKQYIREAVVGVK